MIIAKRERWTKLLRYFEDDANPRHKVIETSVAPINFNDGVTWQEVDELFSEADTAGFASKFTKLPYHVRLKNDGTRRIYPDRNDLSYWIEIGKPFQQMGTPTKTGNVWLWDFANAQIKVTIQAGAVKFGFLLKNSNAPTSITVPFAVSGITRIGNILYHNGEPVVELRKPVAIDANGVEREVTITWGAGDITASLNTTGLAFPIDVDPTIDMTVSAGANDFGQFEDSAWSATDVRASAGSWYGTTRNFGFRIVTGTAIAASATVGTAYVQVFRFALAGTSNLKVYANDTGDASAPTSSSAHVGLVRTTAFTTWTINTAGTAYIQSPSITGPMQELVDSYDYSSTSKGIQVLMDCASTAGGENVIAIRTYENAATTAAKFFMSWTEPGGGAAKPFSQAVIIG